MVFEAKRAQHEHYRLPPTELANIWLGARLTWVGIQWFNHVALPDFPNVTGTNESNYGSRRVRGLRHSKECIQRFSHNVRSWGKKSLIGPQWLAWILSHCCQATNRNTQEKRWKQLAVMMCGLHYIKYYFIKQFCIIWNYFIFYETLYTLWSHLIIPFLCFILLQTSHMNSFLGFKQPHLSYFSVTFPHQVPVSTLFSLYSDYPGPCEPVNTSVTTLYFPCDMALLSPTCVAPSLTHS